MRIYDFVYKEHEDHGFWGLAAKFMEGAEPGVGMTCAHDIVEHFPTVPLDNEGELLALGALLYGRGQGGYFKDLFSSVGTMMGGDLLRAWQGRDTWGDVTDPGPTRPLEEHVEEWLQEAVVSCRQEVIWDCEEIPDSWFEHAKGWLRKGFRKAAQRYAAHSSYQVSWMFKTLGHDLEQARLGLDEHSMAIVRVRYQISTLTAKVQVIETWEPEHPNYVREDY